MESRVVVKRLECMVLIVLVVLSACAQPKPEPPPPQFSDEVRFFMSSSSWIFFVINEQADSVLVTEVHTDPKLRYEDWGMVKSAQ